MKKTLTLVFALALLSACGAALAEEELSTLAKNDQNRGRQEVREKKNGELTAVNLKEKQGEWRTKRQEDLSKLKAEKTALRSQFKEKLAADKCARVQERIAGQTERLNSSANGHSKVYVNLVNRINKFIARFDAAGLDTTAIKTHLAELQVKIDKFKADFAAYQTGLAGIKTSTCGQTEGDFRAALLESKTLLKTVHADAADIRTYVRTVIFADLKALKAQMPKDAAETEADEQENDDQDEVPTNSTGDTNSTNSTGTVTSNSTNSTNTPVNAVQ